MQRRGSVKRNLGYQTIYQILISVLPLITAPYLARTLGASQQGVYSYTASIAKYFILFAMLGISNHGTRSISEAGDDEKLRSRTFSNIYVIQFTSSLVVSGLYVLYLRFFCKDNITVSAIQGALIVACIFDLNWFFAGIEYFKATVIRNCIVRVIVVILILLLVKKPEDLWIYAILMCLSTLISNLVLWPMMPRFIKFQKPKKEEALKNIKPIMVLFVPLMAMTIYHVMDSTMLGFLSDYTNTGYYYNADKVINVPLGIISGFSTVLLPRMTAVSKNSSDDYFNKAFINCIEGVVLSSVAMSVGIAAVSYEFTPLFFGKGFDACIALIIGLAPVMILKSVSSVVRFEYLVPKKMEKSQIMPVYAGAIANLIANWLFIPRYGAFGAVLGTIIAEGVACALLLFSIREYIKLTALLKRSWQYLLFGAVMFIGVRWIAGFLPFGNFLKVCIEIVCGGIIYVLLCFIYKKLAKDDTVLNSIFDGLNKIKIR